MIPRAARATRVRNVFGASSTVWIDMWIGGRAPPLTVPTAAPAR